MAAVTVEMEYRGDGVMEYELCIALPHYSIAPPLHHSIDSDARFVFLPAPSTVMVSGANHLSTEAMICRRRKTRDSL
jgi:hypothetical protein